MKTIEIDKEKLENLWKNICMDVDTIASEIDAIGELAPDGKDSKLQRDAWVATYALGQFLASLEEEFYNPMSNLLDRTKKVVFFVDEYNDADDMTEERD